MTPEAEVVQLRAAVEKMQSGLELLQEDKLLTDRECTKLRREAAALRRMLQDAREKDPNSETIRMILKEWKHTNGRDDRTNIEAGGDRWERVRKFLKKYPNPQDHIDAIKGQHVEPDQWWVKKGLTEIKYVYKGDEEFERFRAAGRAAREQNIHPEPVKPVEQRPKLRVVSTDDYPALKVINAFPRDNPPQIKARDEWEARCPGHISTDLDLQIRRGPSGRVSLECATNSCSLERILDPLGLDLCDLFHNADLDPDRRGQIGSAPVDVRALRDIEAFLLKAHGVAA